jgi:zinc transporter 9
MTKSDNGKIILASLGGNFIIAIGKLAGFLVSGSPSMLAETIHTFADTLNQGLLYMGYRKGKIGPCHRYPMGQGRAQYVFNLMAAIGILIGAIYTIYHGIHVLLHPSLEPITLGPTPFIVLGIAIIIEGWIFWIALRGVLRSKGETPFLRYLKESDDPSILGILFEDGIAVLGCIMALIGIYISYQTQNPMADAVTTILIGILLLIMAIFLGLMNYHLIVGTGLPKRELGRLHVFLKAQPEIERIVHLTTEILAPSKVRLSIEIEFHGHQMGGDAQLGKDRTKIEQGDITSTLVDARDRTIRSLANSIDQLEDKIQREFPDIVLIFTTEVQRFISALYIDNKSINILLK